MPIKRKTFKLRYILDIYALARDGANDKTIAKHLGVTAAAFCIWKRKACVKYALKKAEKDKQTLVNVNWSDYIRERIPDHLKPLWNEITRFETDVSGYDKAKQLLSKKSSRIKQELVVYSIMSSNFNTTKALRRVGVSRSTFRKWSETDPDFAELLNEVVEIKRDFFEEGLIKLVQQGDSPATIFGNRTLNRKRGYGEHISTSTDVNVTVTALPLHELDLPNEVLRTILQAIKKKKQVESQVIEQKSLTGAA